MTEAELQKKAKEAAELIKNLPLDEKRSNLLDLANKLGLDAEFDNDGVLLIYTCKHENI